MFKGNGAANNKKNRIILGALIICCSFVFGFLGGALANVVFENSESGSPIANTSSEKVETAPLSTSHIVALVENSVVEVRTKIDSNGKKTEGAGSGVVVREDGYIATNAHVVDGAQSITVTLRNGNVYMAELVDKNEQKDVAVLKISASGLSTVTFADSNSIKVGENVVVIGNALGTLGGSVTDGIVSAVDRKLTIDDEEMTLIQTDAEINHGNSGGGMFGSTGQCLGIIVAKSTGEDVEGLGFAIPANIVKAVVDGYLDNV